jgi:hypothetical protein
MICNDLDVLYNVWPAYEEKKIVWRQYYHCDNYIIILIITTVFRLLSKRVNKSKK